MFRQRGVMMLGKGEEPAAVIEARQIIDQRQAAQRRLGALALGDVLNLKDKVQRHAMRIANQRSAQRDPHAVSELMNILLLHLAGERFTLEKLAQLRRVSRASCE